jgi:hypothetical protein
MKYVLSLLLILCLMPLAGAEITIHPELTAGSSSLVQRRLNVVSPADGDYLVTATDVNAAIVTNASQTQARTYTLPAAAAGMVVSVYVIAAQTVKIEPNGTDRIQTLTDAAGDSVTSDAVRGTFITLGCLAAGSWEVLGLNGAWSDTN